MMLWILVFSALAVLALAVIGAFAFRVWREGLALARQLGRTGQVLSEQAAPLTEALDGLGAQSPPRRR